MMTSIGSQPTTKHILKIYALLMALLIALLTAVLIAPDAAMAQEAETITFPSRSSELAGDSYWTVSEFGEGCCKMDLNVRRWDGNSWEKNSGSSNEQDYDWNLPIYAPVSGVIASCWRNFPNNEDPDESDNPIFLAGNHVIIITEQGNAIALAHFNPGTLPAELCPSNPGSEQYPSTDDAEGSWRVAAYIDPADRPRVTEGDYIGRVGNSGNSTAPHLHMDETKVTGTDAQGREVRSSAVPIRFRYGWGHRFEANQQDTPDGWFRLHGGEFTGDPDCPDYQPNSPNCGFKMVHASPYLRRGSASAGAVKDVDTVFLSGNRAVTAVIDSDSNLKLVSWDLIGLDDIIRKGDISAGAVKEVQIAEPVSDYVLAAVREQDDRLKMIAYRVAFNGSFSRVADFAAGKISALAMTATNGSDRKAVTAVRDQSGNLKLIVWDIQVANDGTASIVRLGDTSAGSVSAISISPARNFNGVFTAVRDSNNDLKVIPWKLSDNGSTVTRRTEGSAGTIGNQIAVAPLAQGVAAAVQDSEGKLRIVTWSVSSSGDVGARRETAIAGNVSEVSILGTPLAGSNLTTVMRDSSGSLLLVGWAINNDGTNLRRVGSSLAGDATKISADGISRSYPGKDPRDMILTALRDSANNLKLITWDTNLNNP